jgi:hypothetical protein
MKKNILQKATIFLLPAAFFFFSGSGGGLMGQSAPSRVESLPPVAMSETEQDIFRLVNQYRESKGLHAVDFSPSLTYVAQQHVHDLASHERPSGRCNLHSWSSDGDWSPCCYTTDEKQAPCMWNKPRELTGYTSEGYEIAFWTDEELGPEAFAQKAVTCWQKSVLHNRVMINGAEWRELDWKAMGVGYDRGFAVVWFGSMPDDKTIANRHQH